MKKFLTLLCLTFLPVSFPAMAQSHDHAAMSAKKDIYAPAMETMHKEMMIEPSGDADIDFIRGMIPHHQGAIDMANILKENGKNPELQKLADEIIAAQEKEIAFMKDWLTKHDAK